MCRFPVTLVVWAVIVKEMLSGLKSFLRISGPKNTVLCLMTFHPGTRKSLKQYASVMCSAFLSKKKKKENIKWSRTLSEGCRDSVGGKNLKPAKGHSNIRYTQDISNTQILFILKITT